jgi:hypothetical protein
LAVAAFARVVALLGGLPCFQLGRTRRRVAEAERSARRARARTTPERNEDEVEEKLERREPPERGE